MGQRVNSHLVFPNSYILTNTTKGKALKTPLLFRKPKEILILVYFYLKTIADWNPMNHIFIELQQIKFRKTDLGFSKKVVKRFLLTTYWKRTVIETRLIRLNPIHFKSHIIIVNYLENTFDRWVQGPPKNDCPSKTLSGVICVSRQMCIFNDKAIQRPLFKVGFRFVHSKLCRHSNRPHHY